MSARRARIGTGAGIATIMLAGSLAFAATPAVAVEPASHVSTTVAQTAAGPSTPMYLGWDPCDDRSIGLIGGLGGLIALGMYCLYR